MFLGRFDWTSGRFPSFTTPAEGYHGLKYSETFGKLAFALKLRLEVLRDLGATLNPFAASSSCRVSRRSRSARSATARMRSRSRVTSRSMRRMLIRRRVELWHKGRGSGGGQQGGRFAQVSQQLGERRGCK